MKKGATAIAIKCICEELGLPECDEYSQDWAYELPQAFRTTVSLSRYVSTYSTRQNDAERVVLMQLIMDVANDLLDNEELPEELWEDIVELLNNRRTLHSDLIEHWVLEGETLDDAFALTPYVRRALGMP